MVAMTEPGEYKCQCGQPIWVAWHWNGRAATPTFFAANPIKEDWIAKIDICSQCGRNLCVSNLRLLDTNISKDTAEAEHDALYADAEIGRLVKRLPEEWTLYWAWELEHITKIWAVDDDQGNIAEAETPQDALKEALAQVCPICHSDLISQERLVPGDPSERTPDEWEPCPGCGGTGRKPQKIVLDDGDAPF